MNKVFNLVAAIGMAGGAVALVPGSARATLISIGEATTAGGPVTRLGTDGGTGIVTSNASIGQFTTSTSAIGSPASPQPTLNTASIDVSASAAGTLYMFITEQGLTSPSGVNNFLSAFTFNSFIGNGITSVTENTFVSTANALWGGTLLATAQDTNQTQATKYVVTATPSLATFSETAEYIITANGTGTTNDTIVISAAPVAVPEPASLGILGLGLGLISIMTMRRRGSI